MKKIAVVGLYSIPNVGDRILCDVTEKLIEKYDDSLEIIQVDVLPRREKDYKGIEYIKYRISRRYKSHLIKKYKFNDNSKKRYNEEKLMWKLRVFQYYKNKLIGCDAIIFAGGGFLKFKTQGLNYYAELVLEIANKYNIPTFFNAVGIEGYSEDDYRCQSLKKAINSDVVKGITTRDFYEILENNYLTNENIVIDYVGDPAFNIPDVFENHVDKKSTVYGINVIRGTIFQEYGNNLPKEELLNFYIGLLGYMEENNIDYKLFSNGMPSDQKFGEELLKKMDLPLTKLISAPKTSEELIAIISQFKRIFGMRMHASITAYSLNVPVVGIVWNEKITGFAKTVGQSDCYFEEDDYSLEKIIKKLFKQNIKYDDKIREKYKDKTKKNLYNFIKNYV